MPAVRAVARSPLAVKVPQITVLFWVAKLLTTGMGEVTWDALSQGIGPVLALILAGVGLIAALVAQFRARAYNAWIYWIAVVMVAVFGTAVADSVHNDFGVPYTVSTAVLLGVVVVIFGLWWTVERTLSIHTIATRRREGFYWAAVLATFALGTAAGDWTAGTLAWGYLPSGLVFVAAFALPALAWWRLRLNPIIAFWLCYVMTRPLGASFADYLAGPPQRGGLALGMLPISLVLTAFIIWVVRRLDRSDRAQRAVPVDPETKAS